MKNNIYKIAKIIDEYTVIVNAGSNQEIAIGDTFRILDEKGSAVKDPDTNEIIGYMDLIKGTVTVSEIFEKMCICESTTYTKVNTNFMQSLQKINETLATIERKKLNIDFAQITGGLRHSDAPIRVGDTVEKIKTSTRQTEE